MREALGLNDTPRVRLPNLLELAARALPGEDPYNADRSGDDDIGFGSSRLIANFRAAWGPSIGDDLTPDAQPALDFRTTVAPPRLWTLLDLAEAADSSPGGLSAAWGPSIGDDVPTDTLLPWLSERKATSLYASIGADALPSRRLASLLDLAETGDPSLGGEPSLSAAWGPSVGDDIAVDGVDSSLDLYLGATVAPPRLWSLLDLAETADRWLGGEPNLSAGWGPSAGDDVVCLQIYLP